MLAIDSYTTEWLNLVLRMLHVIAAIAWIGSSFYFIALDLKLERPADPTDEAEGVAGEAWEIHGGGFYHVQKYRVAPPRLPERLLWFKWEAYTTWLSGFGLLLVLYYLNAPTYLVDPSVSSISTGWAIVLSIGLLAAAWGVYDLLCRVLAGREAVLAACLLGLVTLTAWGTSEVFAARAAFLQVGAMLGTMMAGNVFFVIIPAHWELVRAKQAGREPDEAPGLRGKQRSVHNNYLTLPVLFTMLAGHFPSVYSAGHAWLALVALLVVGAWIRLFFNLRHAGRTVWAIPITAAAAIAGIAIGIRPAGTTATAVPSGAPPGKHVFLTAGCAACHTLADAGAKGVVGPNLDQAKPSQELVIERVSNGLGVMPSFRGRLRSADIAALAAYVSSVAGR
jgi:uncharacterized membrane protein